MDSPNPESRRLFFKVNRIRGASGKASRLVPAPCGSQGPGPFRPVPLRQSALGLTRHTHTPALASLLNENLLPACHSPVIIRSQDAPLLPRHLE